MGNLVLLEIAEIYAEDPYVEYENADSSPQDEILIENSVRIECDWWPSKNNADKNNNSYNSTNEQPYK